MGGMGSGGHNKRKFSVESCNSIDIRRLKREGYLKPGRSFKWAWYSGNETKVSIGIAVKEEHVVFSYTVNKQERIEDRIGIAKTACNYGSYRDWFVCPGCGKRVAKLYLEGKYFRCRTCQGLNYRSSQKNGDVFQHIDSKIYHVYGKLKGDPIPFSEMMYRIPYKPKNMHYKTYTMHRNELMNLWSTRDRLFLSVAREKFGFVG